MAVVLVTGGSSGIGLATAIHFAQLGHDVHAGVRNPASATELAAASGPKLRALTLDVNDDDSVRSAVADVLQKSGRIDVLVNNAGIGGGGPIADVPVDFAKAMFETNYFGAIRMIQAVLPGMQAQRSGAIVNVSSVWGRVAIAGHGHYCAAKHALEGASEALAQEVYALGIRVAIVEPGAVRTPIFQKARRFADPASPYAVHVRRLLLLYQLAMETISQPEDVARAIHDAALGDAPRMRHVVGDDARRVIEGRARITDEEYAATGREMSEEDFLALNRRRYQF